MEPKVLFIKPVPMLENLDFGGAKQKIRRQFNRYVEKIIRKFKYFFTVNIESFLPSDGKCYEVHTNSLSLKGFEKLWISLNKSVKAIDEGNFKLKER